MSGDELDKCRDELHSLKEENQHLREAANSFGALAERLRDRLEVERRQNATDRRAVPRDTPERRQRFADASELK